MYDEAVREFYALASKLAALRSSTHPDDLETDERFARAVARREELQQRAQRSLDTAIDAGEFEDLVRESGSTNRNFEDADDEEDSGFRFD